jgi:uncharacterized protein DUF4105
VSVARLALLVGLATAPAWLASAAAVQEQAPPPAVQTSAVDTAAISVYLVTFGVGPLIWERFGHNAIRVVDRTRGTDLVYNWGTFNFRDPDFIPRFLSGDTRYYVDTMSFAQTVQLYRQYYNRSIALQRLNLTPAQQVAVRDFVEWNIRAEHRVYRYDYFLDNCSTRVRDVIDRAINGALRAATADRPSGTTFRWHTRRLLGPDFASYTGIEVALGEPADRPITAWEEMFLPAKVQQYVREVRIHDATGAQVPLVAAEQTVFTADHVEPTRPPRYFPIYLCLGVALGAIALLLGVRAANGGRGARIGLASFAAIWGLLAGLIGVLLIVAWTATLHIFWKRNENLFQFEPLALLVAFVVPVLLLRGRRSRVAATLTATVAAIALLGAVLQLLPGIDQVNADIVALALPIWLGLAAAVRMASRAS